MTETTEWFNFGKDSKAVRVLDKDNQKWMPLSDIAYCIGYDRSGLNKLVDQNSELFAGMKGMVVTTTPGGSQELVCLNRDGVVGILMKLSYARIKDPVRKQKVVQFQKWAVGVLNSVIKNGGVPQKGVQLDTVDPIKIAIVQKKLAQTIHGDAHDLIVAAYLRHDLGYLTPHVPPHHIIMQKPVAGTAVPRLPHKTQTTLAPDRPLIETITGKDLVPPSPKPEGMLSATDIGRIIGKTAEQVNKFLYNNKLIEMDADHSGEWRITNAGKTLGGDEFKYKPHPAAPEVYRVFWKPKILEKFNVRA